MIMTPGTKYSATFMGPDGALELSGAQFPAAPRFTYWPIALVRAVAEAESKEVMQFDGENKIDGDFEFNGEVYAGDIELPPEYLEAHGLIAYRRVGSSVTLPVDISRLEGANGMTTEILYVRVTEL